MKPLVSVWMITYNQEQYIAQALESVLMQKTDFAFEVVIGEDSSPDTTREICLKYKGKFPDKIRLVLHDKNIGLVANFWETLKECRGKYIAQLEGDDYWSDPQKLQKQVDLLEANPNHSFCYHRFDIVDDTGKVLVEPKLILDGKDLPADLTTQSIIDAKWSPVQTLTLLFRCKAFSEMPSWIYKMPIFDWPLHFYLSRTGTGVLLNQNMACYRSHAAGVWSGQDHIRNALRYYYFYKSILEAHPGEYDSYMLPRIRFHTREMLEECLPTNNPKTVLHRLGLYLRHHLPGHVDWPFVGSMVTKILCFLVSALRIKAGSLKCKRAESSEVPHKSKT